MGKSLQQRIKALEAYSPSMTFTDGNFVLGVVYKDKWVPVESDNTDIVAFTRDNQFSGNRYLYACTLENVDVLFDLIDITIDSNKELEKKTELYQKKVKELQELFLSDTPYEVLKTLEFKFPTLKKTKKQQKVEEQPVVEQETSTVVSEPEPQPVPAQPSEIDEKINKLLGGK